MKQEKQLWRLLLYVGAFQQHHFYCFTKRPILLWWSSPQCKRTLICELFFETKLPIGLKPSRDIPQQIQMLYCTNHVNIWMLYSTTSCKHREVYSRIWSATNCTSLRWEPSLPRRNETRSSTSSRSWARGQFCRRGTKPSPTGKIRSRL